MSAKKIVIASVSLLTAAGIVLGLTGAAGRKDTGTAVRTVTLEKGALTRYVSATGMIYSNQSIEVYSNLSYPVAAVHVSAGDRVSEGDVLCELNTSDVVNNIAQKQAAINSSAASAQLNLETAQKKLDNAQSNLENNYDSQMIGAEDSVRNAEAAVRSAEESLTSAETDLAIAIKEYNNACDDNDDADEDGNEVYTKSQMESFRSSITKARQAVEQAENKLADAQSDYEASKANVEATKNSRDQDLDGYEDDVKNAQLALNMETDYIELRKYQKDLSESVITAPISGTVTEVNAVEGGSGSGKLFVIQETDNLKIISNIKEYDIGSVEIGDKVIIKADATGNQEFEGKISKIAPTSTLTTSGSPQNSTDAEYETEIAVSSSHKGLRVGMNTRLNVVIQEKKNVYAVPYEAVGQNETGEAFILIAAEREDGSFTAEALAVTIGMETDLRVEISAESLTDGMLAIKNIEGVTPGTVIAVEA